MRGRFDYTPAPTSTPTPRRRPNGKATNSPILAPDASAALRDQLLNELAHLSGGEQAAQWAHKTLPTKSTLTDADARQVEDAFAVRLAAISSGEDARNETVLAADATAVVLAEEHAVETTPGTSVSPDDAAGERALGRGIDKSALTIGAPRRYRDKAHLAFVALHPCLVCARRPADPHHLRFAQPATLGRKVSDEFSVPLCRSHHRDLHRSGNERLWWESLGIDPLKIARQLWEKTRSTRSARADEQRPVATATEPHMTMPATATSPGPGSDAATQSERSETQHQ